jgi:hypothetical protein
LLYNGQLSKAEQVLQAYLATARQDQAACFQLGIIQFLAAVECLAQDIYAYGPTDKADWTPMLRLPVPPNPQPRQIIYPTFQNILLLRIFGGEFIGFAIWFN